MFQDRGNLFQFVTLEKDLAPAGRLNEEQSWNFDFKQVEPERAVRFCACLTRIQVEKQYEAFNGLNVRLRYFLRFTIFVRRSLSNIVKEKDFWVHNYQVCMWSVFLLLRLLIGCSDGARDQQPNQDGGRNRGVLAYW